MLKKLGLITALVLIMESCVFGGNIDFPVENKLVKTEEQKSDELERFNRGEMIEIDPKYYYDTIDLPIEQPAFSTLALRDDSYSAYSQLNSFEKTAYNYFKNAAEKSFELPEIYQARVNLLINKGYDINTQKDTIDAEIKDAASNFALRVLYGVSNYDYPEYFWIGPTVKFGRGTSYTYDSFTGVVSNVTVVVQAVYPACYENAAQVESDYNKMNNRINEVMSLIPDKATDFEKVNIINEWLLAHNSYNRPAESSGDPKVYPYAYMAPSALVYGDDADTAKHPVCEGYSEAFEILCDRAGVKCICGDAISSERGAAHKWNLVNINDKWYFYDATWNDSGNMSGIGNKTNYMLIGSNAMKRKDATHNHDTDISCINYKYPNISTEDYIDSVLSGITYINLDVNKDNYINMSDGAGMMKNIINGKPVIDINDDGYSDIRDVVGFIRLLRK